MFFILKKRREVFEISNFDEKMNAFSEMGIKTSDFKPSDPHQISFQSALKVSDLGWITHLKARYFCPGPNPGKINPSNPKWVTYSVSLRLWCVE